MYKWVDVRWPKMLLTSDAKAQDKIWTIQKPTSRLLPILFSISSLRDLLSNFSTSLRGDSSPFAQSSPSLWMTVLLGVSWIYDQRSDYTVYILNLFSVSSVRYFFIHLQHFIWMGFFALSRIQPFATNGVLLGEQGRPLVSQCLNTLKNRHTLKIIV